MIKEDKKIVMGISMPRTLRDTIDRSRGDIPRSTYIAKILQQVYIKQEKENGNYNLGKNHQSISRRQPGRSANSSALPFTDLEGVESG